MASSSAAAVKYLSGGGQRPAIAVHGGAGGAFPGSSAAQAAEDGCRRAARTGFAVLDAGGLALEAVVAAVAVLEDDPVFNAGTGSVLNADGDVEADAMVMDGSDLSVGGVCALRGFANPVKVARAVLEVSPHVLLAGEGAVRFALGHGFAPAPAAALVTAGALERWRAERDAGWPRWRRGPAPVRAGVGGAGGGTVGAVAVASDGDVAAATSTGGITGKLPGRVGDTPLVGCGTYADNERAAASATGDGEAIARVVLAKHACDLVAAGKAPAVAAAAAVAALRRVAGRGGVIVAAPDGSLGFAFNTRAMSRAWVAGGDEVGSAVT